MHKSSHEYVQQTQTWKSCMNFQFFFFNDLWYAFAYHSISSGMPDLNERYYPTSSVNSFCMAVMDYWCTRLAWDKKLNKHALQFTPANSVVYLIIFTMLLCLPKLLIWNVNLTELHANLICNWICIWHALRGSPRATDYQISSIYHCIA